MRSCMYCGRELEKGEMCTCSQSVAHRKQKEQASANTNEKNKEKHKKNEQKNESYTNPYRTETYYKTGYVGKEQIQGKKSGTVVSKSIYVRRWWNKSFRQICMGIYQISG